MGKPHTQHVSEMYSKKYFTKYCENAGSVEHGSGLPYDTAKLLLCRYIFGIRDVLHLHFCSNAIPGPSQILLLFLVMKPN